MRDPLPPPMQALNWRRRVFTLAVLSLLGGCANSDFGRLNSTLVHDDMHDWVGPYASARNGTSPSSLELTDDERALRDLAYPFIEPPYDRQQVYSVAGEYGALYHETGFDQTAYTSRLLTRGDRSPSARYAQLNDDIRNDIARMPQFFEIAARVLDVDQKRHASMAYVSGLSREERDNAFRRIHENAAIVSLVRSKLAQRVASYRFALGRLVIMTPSAQAADVERTLGHMQAQIARYRHPPQPWVREQNLVTVR